MSDETVRLSLDEVAALSRDILAHHGLAPQHVEAVTETIVAGERDECASHGIYRLLVCVNTLRTGKVVKDAVPVVHDVAPALVRVDAGGGFAQTAFGTGLPLLVEKARHNGIAALGINNCVHFAALWPEVEAVAAAGLVAFACTPSHAWVAPAGGIKPLFGTNPIAFGWPRPAPIPMSSILRRARSRAARSNSIAARASRFPKAGASTPKDSPRPMRRRRSMARCWPSAATRGSALATMVELIAGPLIGDLTSAESIALDAGAGSSPIGGEFILAIDPRASSAARRRSSIERAEQVFDAIVGQGARLPSQRRFEARARAASRAACRCRASSTRMCGRCWS